MSNYVERLIKILLLIVIIVILSFCTNLSNYQILIAAIFSILTLIYLDGAK